MRLGLLGCRKGIEPDNLEKINALAAPACRVAAHEPGTLAYGWDYSAE